MIYLHLIHVFMLELTLITYLAFGLASKTFIKFFWFRVEGFGFFFLDFGCSWLSLFLGLPKLFEREGFLELFKMGFSGSFQNGLKIKVLALNTINLF
ncbi:hypothetical protein RCL_jg21557.t1 [Rhizophagus clarus]|uniref:Uncharacterized protein n=1 Tax=Rhizophagus clarus TaxID=94130 RepID=A0A8H3L3M1_9GLOM|nr:hypothetical protein RCL_jg21557.t1 [Rhizophagus clarus]